MRSDETVTLRSAVKRLGSTGSFFELSVPALSLSAGEICVVLGSSGCGKTTLLDALGCISDFTVCKHFSLRLAGRETDMTRLSAAGKARLRRQSIGYILQQGGLLPYLTAWENIELPLRFSGRMHLRAEAHRMAEELDIADQLNKKPSALSIGQRQRVSIVRALAFRPALLLADEPTGALDPVTALEVKEKLIAAARQQGTTLVVVTHDAALFSPVADRCLGFDLMRAGTGGVRSTLLRLPRPKGGAA